MENEKISSRRPKTSNSLNTEVMLRQANAFKKCMKQFNRDYITVNKSLKEVQGELTKMELEKL